jgi:hypothetical protein
MFGPSGASLCVTCAESALLLVLQNGGGGHAVAVFTAGQPFLGGDGDMG